jgi:hypothetical protein
MTARGPAKRAARTKGPVRGSNSSRWALLRKGRRLSMMRGRTMGRRKVLQSPPPGRRPPEKKTQIRPNEKAKSGRKYLNMYRERHTQFRTHSYTFFAVYDEERC